MSKQSRIGLVVGFSAFAIAYGWVSAGPAAARGGVFARAGTSSGFRGGGFAGVGGRGGFIHPGQGFGGRAGLVGRGRFGGRDGRFGLDRYGFLDGYGGYGFGGSGFGGYGGGYGYGGFDNGARDVSPQPIDIQPPTLPRAIGIREAPSLPPAIYVIGKPARLGSTGSSTSVGKPFSTAAAGGPRRTR